MNTQETKKV